MDRSKLAKIAEIAGMEIEDVEEVVDYGWLNADEHAKWLETAEPEEIADWVATVAQE